MNIYFFDPSHIKPKCFFVIFKILKIKVVYLLTESIDPAIKEFCGGCISFRYTYSSEIHKEHNKHLVDPVIYHFVNTLRHQRELLDLYQSSSNNPIRNLKDDNIDDPNILIILPPVSYQVNDSYEYEAATYFPQHFSQYSLNILKKNQDDRYSERLSFLFIDAYLGISYLLKRKIVYNRFRESKYLTVKYWYNNRYAVTWFIVHKIIEQYPKFKNTEDNKITSYISRMLKEVDYKEWKERRDKLKEEKRQSEIEKERLERAVATEQDWMNSIEDMYRDAFDGNPENQWNTD